MECNSPPPLTDEALSLALDELADEATQQHLAQCEACAGRLAQMKQLEAAMQKRLRRFQCPSAQRLSDYHLGMLDADSMAAIKAHVEGCPRCQDDLAMLIEFLDLPPEEAVSNKVIPLRPPKNIWRAAKTRTSGSLALKGTDNEASHDMEAGSAKIFLETKATPQGFLLTGQVTDNEIQWAGALIAIWQGSAIRWTQTLDEMGEFKAELTDSAPVTIYITASNGVTIQLEGIVIKA